MLKIKTFYVNILRTCCYLVWSDDGTAAVIDPGFGSAAEFERMALEVGRSNLTIRYILLTHGHFDHALGLDMMLSRYGLIPHMHPDDVPTLAGASFLASKFGFDVPQPSDRFISVDHGDVIELGEDALEVIHTPGHSPGGVCYHCAAQKLLFSGDTLFEESIGRTDVDGGDMNALLHSIKNKLLPLPDDTLVLPGHGYSTTIGHERRQNPYIV